MRHHTGLLLREATIACRLRLEALHRLVVLHRLAGWRELGLQEARLHWLLISSLHWLLVASKLRLKGRRPKGRLLRIKARCTGRARWRWHA